MKKFISVVSLVFCIGFSHHSFAQGAKEIPAGDDKKVEAKKDAKKKLKTVVRKTGKDLKYRIYANKRKGRKWVKKVEKQLSWWIKTINQHCKPEKVKFNGFTALTHDYKEFMFTEVNGSRKKIYKFQTAASSKNMAPEYEWIQGFDAIRSILASRLIDERKTDAMKKTDAELTTFHIPVFKEVYAHMRGRDAMIPGMVRGNILVLESKSNLADRQHEIGHLFGLEDDKGGIMTKIRPDGRNELTGRYDNEKKYGWKVKSVRDYRCSTIKKYFGFK